ncbi:MAG TPA: ATP-binding protein, partial [Nitrospiraceae bacterium]|nr:ATP-binding protein [Nitrospiraceae bacterium]
SVVTNLDSMLSRLIGEDVQLAIRTDPEQGHVKADQGQLEQVIMNLVINARDAMPNGGLLVIETSQVQLTRTPMHHIRPLPPGPYMKLTVTDTGCGMDQDTLSHLFEPFFTTKEEHKGTGLGLSTVFGIVTKSGGAIDVWSQVGHGTTFDIYLPRINPEAPSLSPEAESGGVVRGNETILVVEDEPSVRDIVREELTKIGYQVVEAMNGIEACLIATQQSGQFDLLLTDIVMPGMNGRELAGRLHLIYPNLKILFMSGYLDDVTANAGLEQCQTAFIQKPFTPEGLARSVRKLLDAPTHFSRGNSARPINDASERKTA